VPAAACVATLMAIGINVAIHRWTVTQGQIQAAILQHVPPAAAVITNPYATQKYVNDLQGYTRRASVQGVDPRRVASLRDAYLVLLCRSDSEFWRRECKRTDRSARRLRTSVVLDRAFTPHGPAAHPARVARSTVTLRPGLRGDGRVEARPRCAFSNGFSLHADLDCHQRDRRKLERLLRYGLRPPFAQKRLSLLPDGKVRLKLRKPFYTGQTDVVFEATEFLRRLATAVPKPMQNMIRYHGIFAANARHRADLQNLLPAQHAAPRPDIHDTSNRPTPPRRRYRWLDLLERVFGYCPSCPRCHGPMQIIQAVEDPKVIERILTHLGLPTDLPLVAPARAPPGDELDLCFAQTTPDTAADWLD